MKTENFCPQCPNHCSKDALMCGRGQAYFGGEQTQSSRHMPRKEDDSIIGLLRQCGHILHHGTQSPDIDKLTPQEQQSLRQLLIKLMENWK